MTRSAATLGVLIALMPLAVEAPIGSDSSRSDPSFTRFRAAAGYGSYAFISRGCQGEVIDRIPASYHDVAGAIEHHDGATHLTIGVRGGRVHDDIGVSSLSPPTDSIASPARDNAYVNPYLAFEEGEASVGFGVVFHEREFITAGEQARTQPSHPLNDFSAHMRIGRLEEQYFELSWMEGMPIASDGGYLTAGVGGRVSPTVPVDVFAGLGTGGPFEGAGLALRGGLEISPGLTLGVRSRIGHSGGANASGVALALEYRFAH